MVGTLMGCRNNQQGLYRVRVGECVCGGGKGGGVRLANKRIKKPV